MLIASINDLAADPEKYAVNSGKDFSRNRQLGFTQPARKRNEYSAFCQMADRAGADTPVIYLCDRGCASYNVFAHVIENSQFFLIRCTDVKTEKILGFPLDKATELDYHADRVLSRLQSKKKRSHPELAWQYRYVCKDVPMDYIIEERTEYGISLSKAYSSSSPSSIVSFSLSRYSCSSKSINRFSMSTCPSSMKSP